MALVIVPEIIHEDGVAVLVDAGHEVVRGWIDGEAAILAALPDAAAALVRTAPFGAELIGAAPGLKVIAKHGVGCDNIDVAFARAQGCEVAITADANAGSVAEHTMALLLAAAKNLHRQGRVVREDYSRRGQDRIVDIAGRRLAVVGYGRIGRRVAALAKALGMEVVVWDPIVTAREVDGHEAAAALDEALTGAGAITVHTPLLETTRNLIDARRLALLAPGALVVNCARGGVVDETALAAAAASGHVGGVASDVFVEEPITPDNPLLTIEGAILTPHTAALSEGSKRAMAVRAAQNVVDALAGRLDPAMIY